ncbi:hypothetical protein EHR03_06700 [Leptospira mayottensis]|nr:hypothetical protein EHR03_06700 [Leptospira mayottensis]
MTFSKNHIVSYDGFFNVVVLNKLQPSIVKYYNLHCRKVGDSDKSSFPGIDRTSKCCLRWYQFLGKGLIF